MEERPIKPWLKSALELGPPILFFIAYLRLQDQTVTLGGVDYDGFIIATVVFIPILLASIAALWRLTGKISRIQVFTAVMVIFFGGLTVWFNDERFFKMKTTIVYLFFAVALTIGLCARQKLAAVPDGRGSGDEGRGLDDPDAPDHPGLLCHGGGE